MSLHKAWVQILGAAVLWAAFAFAPSVAQAHGGHGHSAAPAIAAPVELPVLTASIEQSSVQIDRALHGHETAELRSPPDTAPAGDRTVCLQSCCAGAPCHSGTACMLGSDLSVVLPHDAGQSLFVRNIGSIAGCDPEGIRKPPRSIA